MTDTKPITKVKPSEPPAPKRSRYDWASIAEQLRSAPGEWHLIFQGGSAHTADAIRRGHITAFPVGEFEVQTSDNVRTPPRTCTLHMRFIPKKKGRK